MKKNHSIGDRVRLTYSREDSDALRIAEGGPFYNNKWVVERWRTGYKSSPQPQEREGGWEFFAWYDVVKDSLVQCSKKRQQPKG